MADRAAGWLFEDEGFEALHALGELVVVFAERADVPVEHDVEVALEAGEVVFRAISERSSARSSCVAISARMALNSSRTSVKPSATMRARSSIFVSMSVSFIGRSIVRGAVGKLSGPRWRPCFPPR
jgi:hypothetical protein